MIVANEYHDGYTQCQRCGAVLQPSEWPFCPHGMPIQGLQIRDDTIIGGETIENLAPEPVTFYSRSEKKQWLREHGIVEQVRHVGVQGSDKSKFTQRWI